MEERDFSLSFYFSDRNHTNEEKTAGNNSMMHHPSQLVVGARVTDLTPRTQNLIGRRKNPNFKFVSCQKLGLPAGDRWPSLPAHSYYISKICFISMMPNHSRRPAKMRPSVESQSQDILRRNPTERVRSDRFGSRKKQACKNTFLLWRDIICWVVASFRCIIPLLPDRDKSNSGTQPVESVFLQHYQKT